MEESVSRLADPRQSTHNVVNQSVDLSTLLVTKVADEKTWNLLQPASGREEEANEILTVLERFYDTCKEEFRLKDPSLPSAPFRLLHEPGVAANSGEFESYITLSYCWHNSDWQRSADIGTTNSDGKIWPISTRMMQGVLKQRISSNEGVWIDQLCINQDDPEEKAKALGAMDLIYTRSRLTVIVLEDVSITDQEKDILSEYIKRPSEVHSKKLHENELATLWHLVLKLLSARWFKRAWCSQELQFSREFLILLPTANGIVQVDKWTLLSLWNNTSEFLHGYSKVKPATHLQYPRTVVVDAAGIMQRIVEHTTPVPLGYSKPYLKIFREVFALSCLVNTDKISIAFNVADVPLVYVGGQKSSTQCMWIMALAALAAGDATGLIYIDPFSSEAFVDEWNYIFIDFGVASGVSKAHSYNSVQSVDRSKLVLDMLQFEDVHFNYPTTIEMEKADLFLRHCMIEIDNFATLFRLQSSTVQGGTRHLVLDEARYDMYVQILACSLGCGLDWMAAQGLSSIGPMTTGSRHDIDQEDHDRLYGDDYLLMMRLLGAGSSNFLHAISSILMQAFQVNMPASATNLEGIARHIHYTLEHSAFRTTQMDINGDLFSYDPSRNHKIRTTLAWIDMGSGIKGITWAPNEKGCESMADLVFGVPECLRGPHCGSARRLWVIRRLGPITNTSNKVVGVLPFLTFFPISENSKRITNLHGYKIDLSGTIPYPKEYDEQKKRKSKGQHVDKTSSEAAAIKKKVRSIAPNATTTTAIQNTVSLRAAMNRAAQRAYTARRLAALQREQGLKD